jgi:hypothetical protein
MNYMTIPTLLALILVSQGAAGLSGDVEENAFNDYLNEVNQTVAWHEFVMQNAKHFLISPTLEVSGLNISSSRVNGTKVATGMLPDGSEAKVELVTISSMEAEARFVYQPAGTRQGTEQGSAPPSEPMITDLVINERYSNDSLTVSFTSPMRPDLNFNYTVRREGVRIEPSPSSASDNFSESLQEENFSLEFNGFGSRIAGEINSQMRTPQVLQEISDLLNKSGAEPAVVHGLTPLHLGALIAEDSEKTAKKKVCWEAIVSIIASAVADVGGTGTTIATGLVNREIVKIVCK